MSGFASLWKWAAPAALAVALSGAAAQAQTLDAVKKRGTLACGVSQGLYGFSIADSKGVWSGFDVDFCKALAAAIFDDPSKVTYVPLNAADRFDALRAGKIDVLSRNSSWTMGRETESKLAFAGVAYHDGQGFMIRADRKLVSALELDGAKICAQSGTTSEANAADFFAANGMKFELVTGANAAEIVKAYESGRCDVFTSDVSQLYAERLTLARPGDHTILPDVISKEPLGPVVRQDDMAWFTLVRWSLFALVNAEELGVSSKTLAEAKASKKPDVRRLVGADGAFGAQLGLTSDWAARMVAAVGNYGEIYERNVGVGSKLGVPRGVNQLWSLGGILYAPPLR